MSSAANLLISSVIVVRRSRDARRAGITPRASMHLPDVAMRARQRLVDVVTLVVLPQGSLAQAESSIVQSASSSLREPVSHSYVRRTTRVRRGSYA